MVWRYGAKGGIVVGLKKKLYTDLPNNVYQCIWLTEYMGLIDRKNSTLSKAPYYIFQWIDQMYI